MGTFRSAPPPRSKAVSVYLPARAHRLLVPWSSGRQRSARLAAILDRYDALVGHRPGLDLHEWGVVVQLVGGLAGMREISALWAELLDRGRDGEHLPGVAPEELALKLRRLVPAEQIAVLEVADQVAAHAGSLRERLAVAAGEPPNAVIETLLAAMHRREITSKVMRELVVRLAPPARPMVRLRLPPIVDGASYAQACRRIMRASTTGKITPGDAATLMRNAKATWAATCAAARARHRLV